MDFWEKYSELLQFRHRVFVKQTLVKLTYLLKQGGN
jgi:hypothetical protein